MSFELSEKIDGANRADKTSIAGVENGCGKISCKAFSKDLIVCAIPPKKEAPNPLKGAFPS